MTAKPGAAIVGPRRGGATAAARILGRVGAALLAPLVLLLLWTLATGHGWVSQLVLPAPDTVWNTLLDMWSSGDLQENASISLLRVVFGFSAGTVAGFALGVVMGLSPIAEDAIKPLFTALAQVPALGWIPLLMLLVGIDEALKIIVIARAALVPVTLNTLAGIRNVPAGFLEVGRVFQFNRVQVLRRIVLPAAVPPIFTGIRYGLTHAWLALVAVELLASSEGLGYQLVWGRQMFQLDVVLAAMAVIGSIGLVMDQALALVESRLQRWRSAGP
jgi:sulfonate transport system permease protein